MTYSGPLFLGALSAPFSAVIFNLALVLLCLILANSFRVSNYYIAKKMHRWLAGLFITGILLSVTFLMMKSIVISLFINVNVYAQQYLIVVSTEQLQLDCSDQMVIAKINKNAEFQYLCYQPGDISPSTVTLHKPPTRLYEVLSDKENQQFRQLNDQWEIGN